uniref:Uncharacterized protein n=1 Tax=Bacteriophage sp. TaxID=38018 RepID=A0A8D9UHN2_9VIRU|nr:MAG TPA: hypothetical protein [Bacteriophage sp.]
MHSLLLKEYHQKYSLQSPLSITRNNTNFIYIYRFLPLKRNNSLH